MSEHIIVTGTGRAGTTFLMQLFTALGLDTGYKSTSEQIDHVSHAGMESFFRFPDNAPLIVKSPWLCDTLAEDLASNLNLKILHAIVPIRNLYDAAESRRRVQELSGGTNDVWGGLWLTDNPQSQESILQRQLYRLLETLAANEIPVTLLSFPAFVTDCESTMRVLRRVPRLLDSISDDIFRDAFFLTSRPELVHFQHSEKRPPCV